MREQVMVLPPFVERRKTSFSLSKQEEALLNASEESRNWAVCEGENAEKIIGFALIERDHKEAILPEADVVSAQKMENVDAKEALLREARKDEKRRNTVEAPERLRNSPSSDGESDLLLQWGVRKRSRFSRADTHNPSNRVGNHNLKPGHSLADESSVLRKTVRVQADRASPAQLNTSSLASKGTFKATNGVAAKRQHLVSEDKRNQQAKVLKGVPSDIRQGTKGLPSGGGKRGYSSHPKHDQVLQQSKTCALPDQNLPSQGQCVTPLPGSSNDAGLSRNELVWPRLVIALSRKEKEEDFLILKGTKLPQRSKRRPKVAEKALHYCSPGSWLVELSQSRYDVREKKRAKKRTRGLKAMESLDSDSD